MAAWRRVSVGRMSFVALVAGAICLSSCASVLAAGDANRESCSEFPATEASPGFRGYLPDCRAYEMVTPPYEAGQPAEGIAFSPPPVSANGEHLLGLDFAGFAGTENLEQGVFEYGAIYEFSRTPSGWRTESLEPPASLAARRRFRAGSADLSRSLWELVIQAKEGEEVPGINIDGNEAYTFAVREVASGGQARFTVVGPSDSPTAPGEPNELRFQGASNDLGHILFDVEPGNARQFWPGDKTRAGDKSLYEYVGTGNHEPMLVGVKNTGPLEGTTHLNEHAELVSECGTILGSSGDSAYNAVSAEGTVVYFTALACEGNPAVNELYARISGSETVAISEPSETDCKPCDTSGRKSATFEGASQDGLKVFFLSEQALLPGATGENLYMYDLNAEAGKRVVLVSPEAAGVARISEDGSYVYFVAKGVLTTAPNGNNDKAEEGGYNLYADDTNAERVSLVATLVTKGEVAEIEDGVKDALAEPVEQEGKEQEAKCLEEHPGNGGTKTQIEKEQDERDLCDEEAKEAEEKELNSKKFRADISEGVTMQIQKKTGATTEDKDRPFEATPDGQFMVFMSARDLTGAEDTSTVDQIFEYDAQTGTLVRVSAGQKGSYLCPSTGKIEGGYNCDGNTTSGDEAPTMLLSEYANTTQPTAATSALSVSEDGRVFFRSEDALTPQAVQGSESVYGVVGRHENVYEYAEGNVYLISPGDEAHPLDAGAGYRLLGTDESGNDVFFFTSDGLVPQDTDTQASWYDARVGGGFPPPMSPSGCAGEACQGPLSATPFVSSASGSATQTAGENMPPVVSKAVVKPALKLLTRAHKLSNALKACRKKQRKNKRAACVRHAEKRYGHAAKAIKSHRKDQ